MAGLARREAAGRHGTDTRTGHATNTVEHPELVAWRIRLFAETVGKENVIAGTDCGMGYRVHPQIAWAKLKALGQGARLASGELWPGSR
jgi:5-methyltetrahydropteroyltriglutamate--homocysteine methyltransferase